MATLRAVALCCIVAGASGARATNSIHILGTFNGWDVSLWQTDPGMTRVAAFAWRDSVDIFPWHVNAGGQEFKFVTDRAWDDPPDYVLCTDRLDEYGPLSGPVCLIPSGANLFMLAGRAGRYELSLDEDVLHYSARLVEPFTARIGGILDFASLDTRVRLAHDGSPIRRTGRSHADLPVGTVRIYREGKNVLLAQVQSDATVGAFSADSLDGGAYDLRVSAYGYLDAIVRGVTVAPGGATDLGSVTLSPACSSGFGAIQVVGEFNNWDTNVRDMRKASSCVWVDTLHVQAGCYYMKFRTNREWGQDYGTCSAEDPTCDVPLTGSVCLVDGTLALGKLRFPVTATYEFRLDESQRTYQISTVTSVERASWTLVKKRFR